MIRPLSKLPPIWLIPACTPAGITGFLLLARPAGVRGASSSGTVRTASAAPKGQGVELVLPKEQLQPGTKYQLAVHYTHTDAGAPNPLLSKPAIQTVRTPDPVVTNPTVVSVSAPDPAAVPACRERGDAYTAAGCNDVTILVAPPNSAAVQAGAGPQWPWVGSGELTQHLMACRVLPPGPTSRRLHADWFSAALPTGPPLLLPAPPPCSYHQLHGGMQALRRHAATQQPAPPAWRPGPLQPAAKSHRPGGGDA